MTFEEYLKTDLARGVIDHFLRAEITADGRVKFYIHPANTGGDTPDFVVEGNDLIPFVLLDDGTYAPEPKDDWARRQREFQRTGTRYYGDGGTIHHSIGLDIETHEGQVVAVWFRCQHLPFRVSETFKDRADEIRLYLGRVPELHGVEVRDSKP